LLGGCCARGAPLAFAGHPALCPPPIPPRHSPLDAAHGYPLRLVAPGVIGGRAVKWLASVTVAREETSNYYHLHDNRVLPTEVTADVAEREGWFDPHDVARATSYAARCGAAAGSGRRGGRGLCLEPRARLDRPPQPCHLCSLLAPTPVLSAPSSTQ
jgi:hypothetical protein